MNRRPGRLFALILGLALLAAALERASLTVRAALAEPDGGASWIWAPGLERTPDPVAFYAVRDFEIEDLEGRTARIAIVADETYILYVNGRRVGSGGYRRGAPSDLYDVTADLQPGRNRLVVELMSGRGAGGLLARLDLDGHTLAATGADWRIFRRFEAGVLRGWSLEDGEPAEVWRRPPTGRWRPAPPAARAVFPAEQLSGPRLRRAARARPLDDTQPWQELGSYERGLPPGLGQWTLFDWGEVVTGYVTLELAGAPYDAGLLHLGREIPDLKKPADALIVPVPGSDLWIDAYPRSFRYAYVAGFDLRRPPAVQLADPEPGRLPEPAFGPHTGVFGLTPPGGMPLAEQDIRRRIWSGRSSDE